ncbi:hypothetical protein RUM44_000745 [Polyplax serrata]|uniref:Crossover junction endonuclease EME1 n=1 Tax=Polyplax serrata TaxID=468196 RepID=A0ABR1B644_POLSC
MDVILLSSDSEDPVPANNSTSFSQPFNIEDDIFVCDWEDDYPVVDYNLQTEIKKNQDQGNQNDMLMSPVKDVKDIQCDNSKTNSNEILTTSVYDISEVSSSENEGDRDFTQKQSSVKELDNFQNVQKKSIPAPGAIKMSKEHTKQEKEKLRKEKKAEQQRQKACKAAFAENQRNLKPEENIKFLKVHIDNEIINSAAGGSVISVLQQNNIQYIVEAQIKSHIITWSKRRIIKEVNEFDRIVDIVENKEENELLYVINWDNTVRLIHSNDLLSHIETIKSVYLNKNITVVMYGMEKYFEYWKNMKKNDSKKKNEKVTNVYKDVPYVTKDQLEFALTDLQLLGKHNCRLLETPEELSALVYNITKSLSQLDYKFDKQQREENDLDWFAKGDSSHTVKIDKNGVGLIKLWQQQICQFSSVGMETAQAIVSQYNSPLALLKKYEECKMNGNMDGELLLQNIQIRRELGLLSSTRRIGPQLSKKIYKFFMSDDPDAEL